MPWNRIRGIGHLNKCNGKTRLQDKGLMIEFGDFSVSAMPPGSRQLAGRIPALDGIRGLAISLVLLWHGWFDAFGGARLPNHPVIAKMVAFGRFTWSGVDLFFVLSGFLIGGILLDAVDCSSYFRTFYIRRAYRILPLYAVILMAALLVDLHYRAGNRPAWIGSEIAFPYYILFLQNIWMGLRGYFGSPLLGATWSLAVEEQFYLTLPAAIRHTPRRILWIVIAGAAILAPILRMLAIIYLRKGWILAYVLTPCRADALCLGVLAALIVRSPAHLNRCVAHRGWIYTALGFTGLAVAIVLGRSYQPFTATLLGLEYSLLALFYALLLLSTLFSPWLTWLFSLPALRFMGTIAYGVYLLHEPFLGAARGAAASLHPENVGVTMFVASGISIAVAVGLASLSWKYFEEPLVKRSHQYR
jgi:peptidoglycan/LPS O-acetylase OafA/YrhL